MMAIPLVLLIFYANVLHKMICMGISHDDFLSSCNFSYGFAITQVNTGNTKTGYESSTAITPPKPVIPDIQSLPHYNPYQGDVPIYWINLERSKVRRDIMSEHFDAHGYRHYRVKGSTLDDIYIPSDVAHMWTTNHPVVSTTEIVSPRSKIEPSSKFYKYSIILTGLWGRKKNNRIKEIGCTVSHLMAIYQACEDALKIGNKYAMITEDDIFLPFQVNFTEMIATAPSDFGILQVFNSNEDSMSNLWKQYRTYGKLWMPRYHAAAAAFWSTCAYIINIDILRPIIKHIVRYRADGWIDIKLISVPKPPAIEWGFEFCERSLPPECCFYPNDTAIIRDDKVICTYSPRGYQADSYLYGLTRVYVQTTPMITNGVTGNLSTFHQDHVSNLHHNAFLRQRSYINEMFSDHSKLPSYAKLLCSQLIPVPRPLARFTECNYRYRNVSHEFERAAIPRFYHLTSSYPSSVSKSWNQRDVVKEIGLDYIPVSSISYDNVVIPDDVLDSWDKKDCVTNTHMKLNPDTITANASYIKVYVSGLCGRAGRDALHDVVQTANYLLAIYHAINDDTSTSPYALISDDAILSFPFDIDYNHLVTIASKESDKWGILQLSSTYDDPIMTHQWLRYIRGKYMLWMDYHKFKSADSWPWKTYLINKNVLRYTINRIVHYHGKHVYEMKIIAGIFGSCVPASSCDESRQGKDYKIVIDSSRGFHYDVFIPSLSTTFLATVPHFKSYKPAIQHKIQSTLSSNDTDTSYIMTIHRILVRQNEFIASILEGKHPLLPYATKSCTEYLREV